MESMNLFENNTTEKAEEKKNSMNRKMIKALKNKYIYVDIDGTIAEYRFNNHVNAKDGTTNGQTMKEIENHIFLYSRPLKTVIQTLKRAKKEGIWICGAIISPVELLDKIVWLANEKLSPKSEQFSHVLPLSLKQISSVYFPQQSQYPRRLFLVHFPLILTYLCL